MMFIYKRGSEWRKWDLHIHTPYTKLNNQYGDENAWDKYCEQLENSSIHVFGITDYFSIENYENFITKHKEKYPETRKIFFPNIEFRIDSKNSKSEHIQFHVIFSNQVEVKKISCFLNRLPLISTDDQKHTVKYCSKEDLDEVTFIKAMITKANLIDCLAKDFTKYEYVIIGVPNGYGSLRPRSNDGRGGEYAKELDKDCDLFFGTENNVNFYLNLQGDERKNSQLPPKPVLKGSDCHSFEHISERLDKLFTWIKADPTFEGLKQILCEPDDRVKIQINKPEEKSGYHVIKSIEVDHKICKQTILLNSNLNTIIGGRSTGKSTLLELIAHKINPNISDIKEFVTDISNQSVKIIWQDNEVDKNRDIEFFPQNYMYLIASDKEKKNKLIKDIVAEKYDNKFIKSYDSFCLKNKETLQFDIDNLFKLQTNFIELTNKLKEKGDESGLKIEINNIQIKINKIHKNDNFTGNELSEFQRISQEILKITQSQQQFEKDKNEIIILKNQDLFDKLFDYSFNQLSDTNACSIQKIFEDVKKQAIEQWKEKLNDKLKEIDDLLREYTLNIQINKDSEIFKTGTLYFEKNNQYNEFNDRLVIENKKLAEIIFIQKQINNLKEQKNKLFSEIVKNHLAYHQKINTLMDDFSLIHDDVEIKVEKMYLKEKCLSLLKDFINLQSHDRQDFVNDWANNYQSDIKGKIENLLNCALENKIELKAHKDIKELTKGLLTENWFSISYGLTYQSDTFEKMSDGKKAFVILKLLIEFNHKECPILIDQPEDSLDNRSIYNELVGYLKQKKIERQIILVTHNANIVLNADAEEIIVANQHGNDSKNQNDIKFQYISGSLENTKPKKESENIILNSQGIKEHICEILEGGTEAFKKRENKYGIKKGVYQ